MPLHVHGGSKMEQLNGLDDGDLGQQGGGCILWAEKLFR
jgi:hypothetical protein